MRNRVKMFYTVWVLYHGNPNDSICLLTILFFHEARREQIESYDILWQKTQSVIIDDDKNVGEKCKRQTTRGTKEVVNIHQVNELGLACELNILSANLPSSE